MEKRPASSETTACGTLRSVSVMVTLAPTTAAPDRSVTTPRTAAVYEDCDQARLDTARATATTWRMCILDFPSQKRRWCKYTKSEGVVASVTKSIGAAPCETPHE